MLIDHCEYSSWLVRMVEEDIIEVITSLYLGKDNQPTHAVSPYHRSMK